MDISADTDIPIDERDFLSLCIHTNISTIYNLDYRPAFLFQAYLSNICEFTHKNIAYSQLTPLTFIVTPHTSLA